MTHNDRRSVAAVLLLDLLKMFVPFCRWAATQRTVLKAKALALARVNRGGALVLWLHGNITSCFSHSIGGIMVPIYKSQLQKE